jgi:hypothetical protein
MGEARMVNEPMWMSGDLAALGTDTCDDCGYDHESDECAVEDDPDRLHDEMGEEW